MTPKQKELLDYLREYIRQHEYSPSFDEMRERMKLASKSGIHRLVQGLAAEGFITHRPYGVRSISLIETKRCPTPSEVMQVFQQQHGIPGEGTGFTYILTADELLSTLKVALA